MVKRLLATVFALALLVSQVAASGFLIDPFKGAPPTPTISFIGCTVDTADASTYTFTDHATGTAGSRDTIVGISMRDSANSFGVNSVTVGGNAAAEVVDSNDAGTPVQSALYVIDNPTGTTATIVVTPSEAITTITICVWAAYDLSSETATDTAAEFQTSSAAITLSLDVQTGGVAVGMSAQQGSADSATWSGMTERADAVADGVSSFLSYSAADTTTAGTPRAVTVDWSGSFDSIGVSASFR